MQIWWLCFESERTQNNLQFGSWLPQSMLPGQVASEPKKETSKEISEVGFFGTASEDFCDSFARLFVGVGVGRLMAKHG